VSVVEVRDLRVELEGSGDDIVDDVSFTVEAGQVLGLVGESGSGKTTVGVALLGHVRRGARIAGGEVRVAGIDVLKADAGALRRLRGGVISYIAQDPAAALNPALRLGRQLEETLVAHRVGASSDERRARMREVLRDVNLPSDDAFLARYPHQISGGQQQRIAIAIAFACRPKVIVCDEPTTGLDVTTQAHVLQTLKRLCHTFDVAAVYVSHDLGVVAEIADRVMVLYAGRQAEVGDRAEVFTRAAHPYTRRLMAAVPEMNRRLQLEPIPGRAPAPGHRPEGCFFAPRCPLAIDACRQGPPPVLEVARAHTSRCLRAREVVRDTADRTAAARSAVRNGAAQVLSVDAVDAWYGRRQVLHGVSLDVGPNECVAIVGESGSGKTTLARTIIGIVEPGAGQVRFEGELLASRSRDRTADVRRRLQYIFQSPYNSLNPRRTIGDIVSVPSEQFYGLGRRQARVAAAEALERVSLSAQVLDQYPDQLSGGERQRVAIARALICKPTLLVCDEITSALDVSVQASIVQLLARLRDEDGLSLLFVTHNLPLVRSVADRVTVISGGRVVEAGECEAVLDHPGEAYTRKLIADTPQPLITV
jgi:peptide/nickel transport system ATP-binding protein